MRCKPLICQRPYSHPQQPSTTLNTPAPLLAYYCSYEAFEDVYLVSNLMSTDLHQ